MDCSCDIDTGSEADLHPPEIIFCPLHAATPALLEALRAIVEPRTPTDFRSCGFCLRAVRAPHTEDCPLPSARAAIAEAEKV